jgi:hypothetical protein
VRIFLKRKQSQQNHAMRKKIQVKLERENTVGERIARTGRLGSFSEEEEGQDHSKVAMQNRVYKEFEKNFLLI